MNLKIGMKRCGEGNGSRRGERGGGSELNRVRGREIIELRFRVSFVLASSDR